MVQSNVINIIILRNSDTSLQSRYICMVYLLNNTNNSNNNTKYFECLMEIKKERKGRVDTGRIQWHCSGKSEQETAAYIMASSIPFAFNFWKTIHGLILACRFNALSIGLMRKGDRGDDSQVWFWRYCERTKQDFAIAPVVYEKKKENSIHLRHRSFLRRTWGKKLWSSQKQKLSLL